MSGNDLTTGTCSSLPDYNVKNNPNIFNFNPVSKVNQLKELLLAISFNRIFIDIVIDLKNMGRAYYNNNPRKFCSTVNLNSVEGSGGQSITLYLPSAGGVIANSIEYINMNNYNKRTWLMRILQNQKLPTCWSNKVIGRTGECASDAVPPNLLEPNEQVLYYYIKNADFFTRTLQLLTNSFYIHSVQRFQCYVLTFPADLYPGTLKERTFTVTNDFLKAVYSQYLRYSRLPNSLKLPAPIIQNIPYVIPESNMNETQLNKYMNGGTMSFNI
jgi:hypothetical protein